MELSALLAPLEPLLRKELLNVPLVQQDTCPLKIQALVPHVLQEGMNGIELVALYVLLEPFLRKDLLNVPLVNQDTHPINLQTLVLPVLREATQ